MLAHFENRGLKMMEKPILLYFLIIAVVLLSIIFLIKSLRILLYKNKKFILIIFLIEIYFIFVGYYASNNHPHTGGAMYIGSIVGIFVIAKIFSILKQRSGHDMY